MDLENGTRTETAKCPSCGAGLEYSPEVHGMKCPYCGTVEAMPETAFCGEKDIEKLFNAGKGEWASETKVFRCENCGAVTVISKNELSKICAFCGTGNVVERTEMSGMRPDAVLPFKLTKEDAENRLRAWCRKKTFAPAGFKKGFSPSELNGTYSPSFTFDADTVSAYTGRLGEYYYERRIVNGRAETIRRTRYFTVKGNFSMSFDDLLVQATSKIPQSALKKLEPFDTNNAQIYSADYLQGFSATQYERDGRDCWQQAQNKMKGRIRAGILSGYTYDVVDRLDFTMKCRNVKYKYVLLPLYVGHYRYGKKIYNVFVNGRSGRVAGQVPTSAARIGIPIAIGIAAIVAILIILFRNGGF